MGWNELSSRQRDLDRKIENCGIKLDTSSSCLKSVMRAIGASASEAEYVRSRIVLRLRTQAILLILMILLRAQRKCWMTSRRMMQNGSVREGNLVLNFGINIKIRLW